MKIKCLLCNDIIESKSRHDLVSCKCENCYIDGGKDYLHFGGKQFDKILIIFDDGTEVLASNDKLYRQKYKEWEDEKYKSIPVEVKEQKFNAETIKAIEDARNGIGLSKGYTDLNELWEDLEKDD